MCLYRAQRTVFVRIIARLRRLSEISLNVRIYYITRVNIYILGVQEFKYEMMVRYSASTVDDREFKS